MFSIADTASPQEGEAKIIPLRWPKPIWEPPLTVTIEARFSTGERAGGHTYQLTRAQLQELASHAQRGTRYKIDHLTVLSYQVDPYRLHTDANHRDGKWLAEQLERAIGAFRKIHWRGLHYAIVSLGDVIKPNGEPYRNTNEDWVWISTTAGKAARWLRNIQFERITDARNSAPVIRRRPWPFGPKECRKFPLSGDKGRP